MEVILFRRVVAFVLDVAILGLGLFLLQALLVLVTQGMPARFVDSWQLYLWLLATISLPIWCYFIIFEVWPPHATLGKRLMGLEVVSTSDRPIVTTRAARRTAIKLLPLWEILLATIILPVPIWQPQATLARYSLLIVLFFLVLNILIFFFSGGGRSLHDFMSKTRVALRKEKHSSKEGGE